MRPRLACALVAVALAQVPAAASADPYTAPAGQVLWGGQGGYTAGSIGAFERQSGKHPAVFNYFISWGASRSNLHWLGFRLQDAARAGSHPMLSVSPEHTGLSLRDLATGGGDAFLVGLNRLVAEHDQTVYLRPLSEMNNANNPYSAYDHSGRSRGPAYSTAAFKKAWRRIALIERGGSVATIDAELRRLGLPPVRTGAGQLPQPRIALMWVPLSYGNPEIPKNHPQRFVHQFFGFLRSHRRVRMAVYYQSASLKPEFALATHPASRAALRRAVRWPRLTGVAP